MSHKVIETNARDIEALITTTVGAGTLVNVVPLQQKGFYLIIWTP